MDLKLGYLAVGANGLNLSFLPFCYLLPKGTLPPLPPHLQSSNSSLFINYARIDVKPQGRGWAAPREATVKFPTPGQIMNVKFQPPRVNFPLKVKQLRHCVCSKSLPRGSLVYQFPRGSPPNLGLNTDRCITVPILLSLSPLSVSSLSLATTRLSPSTPSANVVAGEPPQISKCSFTIFPLPLIVPLLTAVL